MIGNHVKPYDTGAPLPPHTHTHRSHTMGRQLVRTEIEPIQLFTLLEEADKVCKSEGLDCITTALVAIHVLFVPLTKDEEERN